MSETSFNIQKQMPEESVRAFQDCVWGNKFSPAPKAAGLFGLGLRFVNKGLSGEWRMPVKIMETPSRLAVAMTSLSRIDPLGDYVTDIILCAELCCHRREEGIRSHYTSEIIFCLYSSKEIAGFSLS